MAANNKNDKMSLEEAGRKGGETTTKNHDKEFFQEIGRKGGAATAENHDKEFYQEIGQKDGETRAQQREDGDNSDDNNGGKMSAVKPSI